jgi:hypothetical protein
MRIASRRIEIAAGSTVVRHGEREYPDLCVRRAVSHRFEPSARRGLRPIAEQDGKLPHRCGPFKRRAPMDEPLRKKIDACVMKNLTHPSFF